MEKFSFDKDRCLNCEGMLPDDWNSHFCPSCEPELPGSKTIRLKIAPDAHVSGKEMSEIEMMMIGSMDEGEIGYIKPASVFVEQGDYRVSAFCLVRAKADQEYTMRILFRDDLVRIDINSLIGTWFEPGRPPNTTEGFYYPVDVIDFNNWTSS